MSQEVPVQAQEIPKASTVPLILQYHQQLESLKQQRDQVKVQLEQLTGAVFACEHFIRLYEDSLKQGAEKLAKQAALKPVENQGAINDEQTHDETAKQVAKK